MPLVRIHCGSGSGGSRGSFCEDEPFMVTCGEKKR
ncbi:hypothetical protein ABIA06_003088 [Bradyrhizobium yuanmingense]